MKWIIKSGLVLSMFLFLGLNAQAQGPLEKIGQEIKAKNVKALAPRFDANVEIVIMDREGTYSRAQAAQIVRTFLVKTNPTSFKIIHRGSSGGGSKYGIAEMETSRGKFRVYIYLKNIGDRPIIQELRFEKE